MVLHISVDGANKEFNEFILEKLYNHFKNIDKHKYNIRKAEIPVCPEVKNILNNYNLCNHEIALLYAFDASLSYYMEDWSQYDIVLWKGSVISSYVYNVDENTSSTFIKQINKYFPLMNLHIIIEDDDVKLTEDTTKFKRIADDYKNTIYISDLNDELNKNMKKIISTIYQNLPTCNFCGKLFTPTQKHRTYCNYECSKKSKQDQDRENTREWYHRYKDVMSERKKGALGSKGANLHGTADPNPIAELQKVRNAKKAVGLKTHSYN